MHSLVRNPGQADKLAPIFRALRNYSVSDANTVFHATYHREIWID
jgi:hypothetical protein